MDKGVIWTSKLCLRQSLRRKCLPGIPGDRQPIRPFCLARQHRARHNPSAAKSLPRKRPVQEAIQTILRHELVPNEVETLQVLKGIQAAAKAAVSVDVRPNQDKDGKYAPADSLLDMDSLSAETEIPMTADELSQSAFEILCHKPVYITPAILAVYVDIQSILRKPATLPDAFELFAGKRVPDEKSSKDGEIQYQDQNANAINSAIPSEIANRALTLAVQVRDLPSALDVITTSYGTLAYRKNKIFRKAGLPIAAAALMPFGAFGIAIKVADLQSGLPPGDFANYAFAGITTYALTVGSIGYIALTTSNDQMERVTWALGTPLWERWSREEERAASEAVVKAWGFREKSRWGEEEGPQWSHLKNWLAMRDMVLDRVNLMEGME